MRSNPHLICYWQRLRRRAASTDLLPVGIECGLKLALLTDRDGNRLSGVSTDLVRGPLIDRNPALFIQRLGSEEAMLGRLLDPPITGGDRDVKRLAQLLGRHRVLGSFQDVGTVGFPQRGDHVLRVTCAHTLGIDAEGFLMHGNCWHGSDCRNNHQG